MSDWDPGIEAFADYDVVLSVGIPLDDFSPIVRSEWEQNGRRGGFSNAGNIRSIVLFRENEIPPSSLHILGLRAGSFHINGLLDLSYEVRRRAPSLRAARARLAEAISSLISIFHDHRDQPEWATNRDVYHKLVGMIGVYAVTITAWDGAGIEYAGASTKEETVIDRLGRMGIEQQQAVARWLVEQLSERDAIPAYVIERIAPWLGQEKTSRVELEW